MNAELWIPGAAKPELYVTALETMPREGETLHGTNGTVFTVLRVQHMLAQQDEYRPSVDGTGAACVHHIRLICRKQNPLRGAGWEALR